MKGRQKTGVKMSWLLFLLAIGLLPFIVRSNYVISVMLMVGNVAPEGSGLVVRDLEAEIARPPDRDPGIRSRAPGVGVARPLNRPVDPA